MDNFVQQHCRLCLCAKSNENFETISDITMGNLDILLLKLDLDQNKHVICEVCTLKVKEALKFKFMCLCTENFIMSHVNDETGSSLDIMDIYAEEKGKQLSKYRLYSHKVCRLCMQLIKGKFMSVHEVEIEAIEKHIPEINLNIIKDPVVCQQCFDSIDTHSSFLKSCLGVNETVKSFYDSKGSLNSYKISSVSCIETEDSIIIQEQTEYKEEYVKNKPIVETLNVKVKDIKQENNEDRNRCMETKLNINILEKDDAYEIKTECIDIKLEDNASETTQLHECLYCDMQTASKSGLENHIIIFHRNSSIDLEENLKEKSFQCDKCSYANKYRSRLKRHQLIHKDPSQVPMYKCDKCSYESKFRSHLKDHQISHKAPSEVRMYKCDECTFKTKFRIDIKMHQLRHRNPPIKDMLCSFETKREEKCEKT